MFAGSQFYDLRTVKSPNSGHHSIYLLQQQLEENSKGPNSKCKCDLQAAKALRFKEQDKNH